MLVLTRKKDQAIFIGEDIRIVVVAIQENQVKIGVACPDAIPIMRGELGTRTKKGKWPNMTPDEIAYLLERHKELTEWWMKSETKDSIPERHDLSAFIQDLERWALAGYLERYKQWYKGNGI